MTTPINSLQIVIGKLFSKLLQIIILLAVSLPILAIVRVFGGVSWEYIISSFFITLSAAIFAGSISLAFSIKNIHTYVVIIKAFFAIGVVYVFIPLILAAVFGQQWINIVVFGNPAWNYPLFNTIIHFNPLGTIFLNTTIMRSPGFAGAGFFYWPVHCIIMLITSGVILTICVKVVRKVAMQQAIGQLDLFSRMRISLSKAKGNNPGEYEGTIREVTGQPVLWKEVRKPIIQGIDDTNNKIGFTAAIVTLLITYSVFYRSGFLDESFAHLSYVIMFAVIGMIFNLVLSVSSITSEKESSAWPILLTTSLDDWQIIFGKASGVFYRCLPVWLLMSGHVLLFIIAGYIHPIAVVQLPIIAAGLIVFLTGLGLYTSSLFKRTTWAIITSFALVIVMWMVIPVILGIAAEITHSEEIFGLYYSSNPVIQFAVVMNSIGGAENSAVSLSGLKYDWPLMGEAMSLYHATKLLLYFMAFYSFLGLFFAWLAKKRIRRDIN